MAPSTRLLIVRHGETAWNAEGRIQGHLDVELNEAGRQQAVRFAQSLQRAGLAHTVEAVVSSDLSRAVETADTIASVCPGARRAQDSGLRELHQGDLQGKTKDEIGQAKAPIEAAWSRGELATALPGEGGESPLVAIQRGLGALRRAAGLGSTVVVVAHGGLIKWCAVSIELGAHVPSPENFGTPGVAATLRTPLRNCCCSTVIYDPEADVFRGERWFEDLEGLATLEDSG